MSPDTIAAFAEGRIDAQSRDAVERHLAMCHECRRDLAHIVRLRRRPLRKWLAPAGLVAAAAALLLIVDIGGNSPGTGGLSPVRNGPEPTPTLEVVSPDSVLALGGGALPFRWRQLDQGTRYEFTITTEGGSRLYSTGTMDTSIALPDSVQLEPGRTYLWFVDALRVDGRSLTSGVRTLRTIP